MHEQVETAVPISETGIDKTIRATNMSILDQTTKADEMPDADKIIGADGMSPAATATDHGGTDVNMLVDEASPKSLPLRKLGTDTTIGANKVRGRLSPTLVCTPQRPPRANEHGRTRVL